MLQKRKTTERTTRTLNKPKKKKSCWRKMPSWWSISH